jgi:UDP-N-acetylmuramoylalanine--D-glutamate ligase
MNERNIKLTKEWFKGKKVTVMGLGLNGGNLAACLFLSDLGAELTVTDLRTAEILKPSMDRLTGFSINYVLGEHKIDDFTEAHLIIKNPAVPLDSPYLKAAQNAAVPIETDISLFLQFSESPILAVTGSKGKSTVVTALHHILSGPFPACRLGGNITLSPLNFMNELTGEEPVILELSSWQLADLRDRNLIKPEISLITNIMHDHQNRYNSMEEYVADKEEIFKYQSKDQSALFPFDERGKLWSKKTKAHVEFFSWEGESEGIFAWLEGEKGFLNLKEGKREVLPPTPLLPGKHFRGNMLLAAAMAALYGVSAQTIQNRLSTFKGVPHRMEKVATLGGIGFFNDTTATIPDALMAALNSFEEPPLIICGGTDKNLDLSPLENLQNRSKGIFLLKGSATERMLPYIEKSGCPYWGPYESLREAFQAALGEAEQGDNIIMSPGATSFGMFINEFDRGNQFIALVKELS